MINCKAVDAAVCEMSHVHIRRIDHEFHQRRSVCHRRATIRKWGCRPVNGSTLLASFQSVTNISTWKGSSQVAAIIDQLEHSVYLPQHSRPTARRSRPDHTPLNTDCPDSKRNTKLRKSGPQDFDEVRAHKFPATKKRKKKKNVGWEKEENIILEKHGVYRIDIPRHKLSVFRATRQSFTIRRKTTEPYLLVVVLDDVNSFAREVVSEKESILLR